jgi:hypothetical protein
MRTVGHAASKTVSCSGRHEARVFDAPRRCSKFAHFRLCDAGTAPSAKKIFRRQTDAVALSAEAGARRRRCLDGVRLHARDARAQLKTSFFFRCVAAAVRACGQGRWHFFRHRLAPCPAASGRAGKKVAREC